MVRMNRPRILVTNDDGWDAPGLAALKALAAEIGEVYVLAPLEPHSYAGHRVTTDATLILSEAALCVLETAPAADKADAAAAEIDPARPPPVRASSPSPERRRIAFASR